MGKITVRSVLFVFFIKLHIASSILNIKFGVTKKAHLIVNMSESEQPSLMSLKTKKTKLISKFRRKGISDADAEILMQLPENTLAGTVAVAGKRNREPIFTGDILQMSGHIFLMADRRHSEGRIEPRFTRIKQGPRVYWMPSGQNVPQLCEKHLPDDLFIEQSENAAAGLALKLKPGRKLGKNFLIGPFKGELLYREHAEKIEDKSYFITNPSGQVSLLKK
jgi:hypothetical protein